MREQFVVVEPARTVKVPGSNLKELVAPKKLAFRRTEFGVMMSGDFTNVNKRRKEEAVKMQQLRNTLGPHVKFSLFLCGYFNTPYLGYEAAEGIDWVWEHRIDDLEMFGLGGATC